MIAAIALAAGISRFVVMHVTVDAYGVPGTGTIVVDRQTGRFARRFSAGPASEQEGWDGVHAWRADATGFPRIQGNSAERGEILQWSSALLNAVDATAHDARLSGATDHVDVAFEQYRAFGDVTLPSHIDYRSEQNGEWTTETSTAETPATLSDSAFAPPRPPAGDYRLDHVTRIPISMAIGSPTLQVSVNGKALDFAFDTGGQNVISNEAAKRIGLAVVGHGIVSGGAGGTTTIRYATADAVKVGDATLFHQPFIALPADSLPGVDGIVGYELLARLAARLDMLHLTLELAPSAAAFAPSIAPEHFEYFDRQPQVTGSLDDVRGALSIDTGSSLTAAVPPPVVQSLELIQKFHATVTASANDVGGKYPIYIVRANSLRLGTSSFDEPLVDLLTRESTSHNTSIIANVGDGILRRWIVVFDYPHQTIDLRPGGDPAGNVVHDRSGMVLAMKSGALVVAQVFGGTPAAEAGITEGSEIVAVDGTTVHAEDLDRVRTLLRSTPGTVVRVQLGNGSTRELTLRKYL